MAHFETEDNLDGGTFDDATPYATGDNADGGDFTYSELTNYDGGNFIDLDRFHHIYSLQSATIGTDDIIITGVQVKQWELKQITEKRLLFGETGYVIEISDNPLDYRREPGLRNEGLVGAKIVGMRFRPCRYRHSDPSIEGGGREQIIPQSIIHTTY